MNQYSKLFRTCCLLVTLLFATTALAASADKIDRDADKALEVFREDIEGADVFLNQAAGYLVFPRVSNVSATTVTSKARPSSVNVKVPVPEADVVTGVGSLSPPKLASGKLISCPLTSMGFTIGPLVSAAPWWKCAAVNNP